MNSTIIRHHLTLSIVVLLIISCVVSIRGTEQDATTTSADHPSNKISHQSARYRLNLSDMINFDEFKSKFHKKYHSIMEELSRRRLYIAHAIQSVASKLAYKISAKNWYKSINHMSDWSARQFRQTLMKPPPNQSQADIVAVDVTRDNLTKVGQVASKTTTKKGQPTTSGVKTRLQLARLKQAATTEVDDEDSDDNDSGGDGGGNETFHDHRDCMAPAKDQGECGACYMFSVTALYEWMYCKQTGVKQSFSEQYAIDCGNHGCAGGLISESIDFYLDYGFQPVDSYPYFERKKRCMHQAQKAKDKIGLGQIRVEKVERFRLEMENQDERAALLAGGLDEGPVLVTILLNDQFYQYGGGVDDALGCAEEIELHAVVLVGDGVEDGNEYWLFKNSHGPDWGENGYYKMNKEATQRCFSNDMGSGIMIRAGYKFKKNTKYDSSIVDKMLPVWLERLADKQEREAE